MKRFERLGALILGGVFLYAGAVKMRDPLAFADSIASFNILPLILINPLVLSLPLLEVFTGLMLAQGAMNPCPPICRRGAPTSPSGDGSYTRRLQRMGAFSVIILCSIFCLALLSALLRGIHVDCGCFTLSQGDLTLIGSGKPSILKTWLALGRDIFLLAAATVLYRKH